MTNTQSKMSSRKSFRYEPAPRNLSVKQLKRMVMREIVRNDLVAKFARSQFSEDWTQFCIASITGDTIGVNGMRDCGAFAQKTFTGLVVGALKKLGVGNEQKGVEGLKKIMSGTRYMMAYCYSQGLPEYKYENGGKGRAITMWIVMDGLPNKGKVICGQTGQMEVSDFKTFCIKHRCYGLVDFTNSLGLEVNKTKERLELSFQYPEDNDEIRKANSGILAELLMSGEEYTERKFVAYELVGEIKRTETIAKYASIAEEWALKPDPEMSINWDIIRISEAYIRRQADYVEGEEIVYEGIGAM